MDTLSNRSLTGYVSRRIARGSAVALVFIACGCVTGRQETQVTRRIQDPPQLSPYGRPLMGQSPYGVGRPVTPEQYGPATPILPRQPHSVPGEVPQQSGPSLGVPTPDGTTAPPPSSLDDQSDEEDTPAGESGSVPQTYGGPLAVTAESPEDAMVGDEITFTVKIRNTQAEAIEAVTVICSLPEGLSHPTQPQRAFQRELGQMEPRAEQAIDLVLRCDEPGWNCVEFQVSGEGIEKVTTSACVAVRDRSVKLELSGPAQRTAGSRAEYVITMANLTGREQPDVHVILEHEGVLEPREASTGAIRRPGRLEWDLGLVRVDERVQIQAEFACNSASERTCLIARVVGRDLAPQEVTRCLQVFPQREIEIDIADEQDPVAVGEKVVYVVRVKNRGLQRMSDLTLEIEPDGLQPLGVLLDETDVLESAEFDRRTGVLCIPLERGLAVDETLTFTLEAVALHPGSSELRAIVRQKLSSRAMSIAESTVVNPIAHALAVGRP